jgi:hypothetical protein
MASKANSTDALLLEIDERNFLQEHPASLFGHLPTLRVDLLRTVLFVPGDMIHSSFRSRISKIKDYDVAEAKPFFDRSPHDIMDHGDEET